MVRIEEGESYMLDLSSGCLNCRNTEYIVAFFRAIVTAKPTVGGQWAPPSARGLTIRCKFASLQALSVLCDFLVSNECQIRVLILSLTNLSHPEVLLLFSALCNNHSIEEFAIYATHQVSSLPGWCLKSLLEHNQSIRKLTLVRLQLLSTTCYAEIAKGLAKHQILQSLSLDSCTPDAEASAVLLEALLETDTPGSLSHLHLGHVHLSKRVLNAVQAIACQSSLKQVSIVDPCRGDDEHAMEPYDFSGLLRPESSIEKLTLDFCDIDDKAAVSVFTALETNARLQELNLPRNNLSRHGYRVMLDSMIRWTHLRRLGVDGGGELLACEEDLVKGMRGNRSLHHLGLETFDLGPYNPQIRSHTRRFLRRNRKLDKVRKLLDEAQAHQVDFQQSFIPPGLWAHILKCVSATRRDHIEMTEAFQLVRQHAVNWTATNGRQNQ